MNIIFTGSGKMGTTLQQSAVLKGHSILKKYDINNMKELPHLTSKGNILIDFSSPKALPYIATYVKASGIPFLCGTTGYSHEELDLLRDLANYAPVLYSTNYSIGIAIVNQIMSEISVSLVDYGFHIEIVETHHIHKKDAPSGTAKTLSHTISGRSDEIPIHSIRGGNVIGEHNIICLGEDEKIEINHSAINRRVFANGALEAAEKLICQDYGWYEFSQLMI